MFYLILTVFIAEIILFRSLLMTIMGADRYVCELCDTVEKRRTLIKWRLFILNDITSGLNEILPKVLAKAKKTKRNIILRYTNELLQVGALLFCKPKYKKLVLGLKTGINIVRRRLNKKR